jgi:LysM repeat protein
MKNRLLVALVLTALVFVAAVPADTAEAAACKSWHKVKRGQTLASIASKYGMSVKTIANANGIKNANRIYTGQRLCIPKLPTKKAPASKTCYKTHRVKRGEFLKAIAARYGVSYKTLAGVNNLKNPNKIYPGQRLKIPVACKPAPKPHPKPAPKPEAKPWKGQYWDNRDQMGAYEFVRYASDLNFDWGWGAPDGIPNDNFSIRWTRTMAFEAGRHLFHVQADDGVRVSLDGNVIIDEWQEQAASHFAAEVQLTKGDHHIQVDYKEHYGVAVFKMQIEALDPPPPPSDPKGWQAEYFDNQYLEHSPVWTPWQKDLWFDWGVKSPKAGTVPKDHFSARWTGDFEFEGAKYRFWTTVDDGVRIYLDGSLILDQWDLNSRQTYWVDIDVAQGKHTVKVEYFENNGRAVAKVWWTKP